MFKSYVIKIYINRIIIITSRTRDNVLIKKSLKDRFVKIKIMIKNYGGIYYAVL